MAYDDSVYDANVEQIRKWCLFGQECNDVRMLVVLTGDDEAYPVYKATTEGLAEEVATWGVPYKGRILPTVLEVYDLTKPIEPQLAEEKAWHP